MAMKFKAYKPSVGSKGEDKAEERAFMSRKRVTVKEVRDVSRADKAKVAATKAFPKGLADRQSSATRDNRQGGMDTGNVMKSKTQASTSKNPSYSTQATPGSTSEAYRTPLTKKERLGIALGQSRRETNQVFDALSAVSGVGLVKKLAVRVGTGILNRASKTKAGKEVGKFLEAPLKRLTGPKPTPRQLKGPEDRKLLTGPKAKPAKTDVASSRPFPQPKKGAKKFPGYTSQLEKSSRSTAAKKAAKTRKNIKQFLNETGLKPERGSTWQY